MFKGTKQEIINPRIEYISPYNDKRYKSLVPQPKHVELTDIPYFKNTTKQEKAKNKNYAKRTRIPKFLVFILLPFFTKLSNFYKVILPSSFRSSDFNACAVCHLAVKYWKQPEQDWIHLGNLTAYNCSYFKDCRNFKRACCKQCAEIGNSLERLRFYN